MEACQVEATRPRRQWLWYRCLRILGGFRGLGMDFQGWGILGGFRDSSACEPR